jgi:hypothetical protein
MVLPLLAIKDEHILWCDSYEKAYMKLYDALISSDALLQFLRSGHVIEIATNASNHAIGAAVFQHIDNIVRYVSFASKILSTSEFNYTIAKKELLSAVYFIKYYKEMLLGTFFKLHMDCKAMSEAIISVTAPVRCNQTMAGWFNKLSQYDFEIYHLPGKKNILPDLCSRVHYINAVTTKNGASMTDAKIKQLIHNAYVIGHFGVNGMYNYIRTTLDIRGIPHFKKHLLEYCSSYKVCGEVND